MALFSKDIKSLHDLFLHTMQDIYYAEKQIQKALPRMIDKASDAQLRDALGSHLEETHGHVKRLEEAFRAIGKEPKGVECPAINGIIKEAEDIAADVGDKQVLDAALAAAAQAVEHYEMTRYGTLIAWSKQLGHDECTRLFEATLKEEKEADKKLSELANRRLNKAA